MTSNRKQKILTAVIETYGTSVTRKNLIEFEQAGRGNCAFIGALYRSGRGTYQLPAVYVETPAERDIRRAKQREYNRAWRAKNPEKNREYQRKHRARKTPEQRTEQRQRAYRLWKAKETPERRKKNNEYHRVWTRARRANETPEERVKRNERDREYQRARYANVEERRERNSRCVKPYPKSYRDRVLANYAARGLAISQRMLDELNGKRDPHTPPLFRRV